MTISSFLKRYYKNIIPYVLFSCLGQLLMIFIVNVTGSLSNNIVLGNFASIKSNLITLSITLILTIIALPLFRFFQMKNFIKLGFSFDEWFYSKFIDSDKSLIDKYEKGVLLNRIFMDPIMYRADIIQLIGSSSIFLIIFTTSFLIMLNINIILSLICVFLSITPVVLNYHITNKLRALDMQSRDAINKIASRESEVINNLFFIKAQNLETLTLESFNESHDNLIKVFKEKLPLDTFLKNFNVLYPLLCNILIYIFISLFISKGLINIGSAINFIGISLILKDTTINLNAFVKSLISFKNSSTRLNELICEEKSGSVKIDTINSITIDNLNFSYPSKSVLDNVNLNINNGDKALLKGKNGCGKSTLCKLLLAIYKNYYGKISINDVDLKQLDLPHLRENIFIAEQFPFILNESIEFNIKCCSNHCSQEDLNNTLNILDLYKIKDKIAGDNGCFLSGGEKQKVSIARAILSKSNMIILDEPNTALDLKTTNLVKNYFSALNKTVVVISHEDNWTNNWSCINL